MPRKPNPQSKTDQLVIKSNDPLEQRKFKAVKEIVSRNSELTIKKALMPGVDLFLRKHNWPPGNSQTSLPSFGVQTKITQECQFPNCHETAEYKDIARHGGIVYSCKVHHEDSVEKNLLQASKKL